MAAVPPEHPSFSPEPERPLTWEERALVEALVGTALPQVAQHIGSLRVVGRCGCGQCPTVYFRTPRDGETPRQLASATGSDDEDGLTGVALLEHRGQLARLEFWSVDGHEPCSAPSIATLRRL